MDGAALKTSAFRTPPRILIPKLVASRDGWKTKAGERKRRLKAARIRIRDLQASRDGWQGLVVDGQTSTEIEAKILGREHRFGSDGVCLVFGARGYASGLPRQFLVRHLPCIGNSNRRLNRKTGN